MIVRTPMTEAHIKMMATMDEFAKEYMEITVVNELQALLNEYKSERENGNGEHFIMYHLEPARQFAQHVLNKRVTWKNWKVIVED